MEVDSEGMQSQARNMGDVSCFYKKLEEESQGESSADKVLGSLEYAWGPDFHWESSLLISTESIPWLSICSHSFTREILLDSQGYLEEQRRQITKVNWSFLVVKVGFQIWTWTFALKTSIKKRQKDTAPKLLPQEGRLQQEAVAQR